MGVFTRLFSRESGAVADTQDAQHSAQYAQVDASQPSSDRAPHESEGSDPARTSIIEVPTALIELTEDISGELATAEPEPPPVTRTVKRPPPKLPPLPIRKTAGKTAPAPAIKEEDDAVELAIDALLESSDDDVLEPAQKPHESDRRALFDTFSGVAKLYVQPLRELMFQLSNGCTPRAWAEACRPLLSPLIHSARQIGLPELADGLAQLDRALSTASVDTGALIGASSRVSIQEAYRKLGAQLPEAFGAPRAADGKRTILLESLLLQVPGLHRRGIGKLYAAGLCSVAQLAQGSPEELSQATGIDRELAVRVIDHVKKFEQERHGLDATRLRQAVHGQLRPLLARLSQLQSQFERAEQSEDRAAKKVVRRARETDVLKVQRLLAELGELELVEELKRCSVRAKLERVESYLQRAEHA